MTGAGVGAGREMTPGRRPAQFTNTIHRHQHHSFTINSATQVVGAAGGRNSLGALHKGEHVTIAAHHHHAVLREWNNGGPKARIRFQEIRRGLSVAVVGDVRKEEDVQRAVDTAIEHFGGVDIVINNASAIATEPTEELSAKIFVTVDKVPNIVDDLASRQLVLLEKTSGLAAYATGGRAVHRAGVEHHPGAAASNHKGVGDLAVQRQFKTGQPPGNRQ